MADVSSTIATAPGCGRLCVTGSRAWEDYDRVAHELDAAMPSVLIHGMARGADGLADLWAHQWEGIGLKVLRFPADWHNAGKSAGPKRNERMLREGRPDQGLAFGALWREDWSQKGKAQPAWKLTGTGDMVQRLLRAGLPVRWVASPDAVAVDLVDEMPGPEVQP